MFKSPGSSLAEWEFWKEKNVAPPKKTDQKSTAMFDDDLMNSYASYV